MKQIPLRGKYGIGKFALVDDDMYEELSSHKWRVSKEGYALRSINQKNGQKVKKEWMARLIIDIPKGLHPDHINHNKLDNQRINLRPVTVSLNGANRLRGNNNTSGIKGVRWHVRDNVWTSSIMIKGKSLHLGYFKDIKEAAIAYRNAAIKHFGSYAYIT